MASCSEKNRDGSPCQRKDIAKDSTLCGRHADEKAGAPVAPPPPPAGAPAFIDNAISEGGLGITEPENLVMVDEPPAEPSAGLPDDYDPAMGTWCRVGTTKTCACYNVELCGVGFPRITKTPVSGAGLPGEGQEWTTEPGQLVWLTYKKIDMIRECATKYIRQRWSYGKTKDGKTFRRGGSKHDTRNKLYRRQAGDRPMIEGIYITPVADATAPQRNLLLEPAGAAV